ncbi:hypothetical protein BA177_00980 [Woeseia oceani]|uniref:Nucleotidyltransferase n=2 Tax=Woeseia oceani TaxID=1548547 RepID=A0A193LC21_9GAMM|nr:hypothetical protein BA177_00980 [Woeseia oceani]
MLLDISAKIDRPIATVLTDLAELAADSNIEFLVVGAMARDMILDWGFGINAGRATRDIDFGIRVADWEELERLVHLLKRRNWHCPEDQQHRFFHESGVPIDLIPFGAIESDDGEICWPPHFNEVLSVIGFTDAYADSWKLLVSRAPVLEIHVASPAGQALLKLAAWRDRGLIRGDRDAYDLRLLMERYLDLDNIARVIEEYADWLDDDFDYPLASARLLGIDVARCAGNIPAERMTTLFESLDPGPPESSLSYAMRRVGEDDDLLYCQRLVNAFCHAGRE